MEYPIAPSETTSGIMKRCAIFFAILIATLLIAVWMEHRHGIVSEHEVVLGNNVPAVGQDVNDPFAK